VLQVLLCDDFRSSRRLLKSKAMQLSAMLLCLLVVTLTSRSALGLVDAGEYLYHRTLRDASVPLI
jgi:hypothetical protein